MKPSRLILPLVFLSPAVSLAYDIWASSPEFLAPVAAPPSGYNTVPEVPLPTPAELMQGVRYAVSSSFMYDSNVFHGNGSALAPIEDDFVLNVAPSISYRTEGARVTFGAHAGLNYASYFKNSDIGGLGYDGGVDFAYKGRPLSVTGAVGYNFAQGVNRNYNSANVETGTFNGSLGASYRWSPKTSFDARFSYSATEPEQDSAGGPPLSATETTRFDLSALWKATPLITIGPGIAWSTSSGDTQVDRDTIGPILRLKYDLTRKVALDGTFGMDFVEYGGNGGSDTAFSTRLGVNYRASSLWGMDLSVFSGTTADGSVAGAYRETTSVRLGYHRKIRRAMFGLGLNYELSDYANANGKAVGAASSRDYFSLDASLGMPVFWRRAQASTFFKWSQESGDPAREWDGYQVGVGLSTGF